MLNNKPDYYNDLDKVYLKVWELLKSGLKNRDLPFHIPVFICGDKNISDGRIVVLRGLDEKEVIRRRISEASHELKFSRFSDFTINHDISLYFIITS